MASSWLYMTRLLALVLLVTNSYAQDAAPSNSSSDIPPYVSSPRFWVNGTDFDHFRIYPLGWYSQISQQSFITIDISGRLAYVNANNANHLTSSIINYISCDPEDYTGVLGPNDILQMVVSAQQGNPIILYSTRANHCGVSSLRTIAAANGVFTTLDPVLALAVANKIMNDSDGYPAVITADSQSYIESNNTTNQPYSGSQGGGPTTAVAMIILYTITGIITALFVTIIVTGAIRAHRHPERYGPQNVAGRPRRTRAKGIARAMLDTIPIVKFGDNNNNNKDDTQAKEVDIEMVPPASVVTGSKDTNKSATEVATNEPLTGAANSTNPDGADDTGQLGCSICTEDFSRGEEVRVLPCNHKFHPECVDPWLLNVSGTCPLCRIDLRPKDEQTQNETQGEGETNIPHFDSRAYVIRRLNSTPAARDNTAFANLRSVASGSREDRVAALRRFRQQRRNREDATETVVPEEEEEQRGLSRRLRERFRVRTRRQGEMDGNDEAHGESSTSAR